MLLVRHELLADGEERKMIETRVAQNEVKFTDPRKRIPIIGARSLIPCPVQLQLGNHITFLI